MAESDSSSSSVLREVRYSTIVVGADGIGLTQSSAHLVKIPPAQALGASLAPFFTCSKAKRRIDSSMDATGLLGIPPA